MPADQEIAHRALSLLAAAEANDGTTPETDAEFQLACKGAVAKDRLEKFSSRSLWDFARRLEQERNGLASAFAAALEENARLKGAWGASALAENARLKAAWDASHNQAMKNGAACNEWRDRAERAEAELAKLRQHAEAMAGWVRAFANNVDTRKLLAEYDAYRADFPEEK